METPLYSYIPHQALAQQNMVLMNKLGVDVMTTPADQPGQRSWRVLEPTESKSPFAEHVIKGYQELTSPIHNNIRGERFIDRPFLETPSLEGGEERKTDASANACQAFSLVVDLPYEQKTHKDNQHQA